MNTRKIEVMATSLVKSGKFTSKEQAEVYLKELKSEICSTVIDSLKEKIWMFEEFLDDLESVSTEDFYDYLTFERGILEYKHLYEFETPLVSYYGDDKVNCVDLNDYSMPIFLKDGMEDCLGNVLKTA